MTETNCVIDTLKSDIDRAISLIEAHREKYWAGHSIAMSMRRVPVVIQYQYLVLWKLHRAKLILDGRNDDLSTDQRVVCIVAILGFVPGLVHEKVSLITDLESKFPFINPDVSKHCETININAVRACFRKPNRCTVKDDDAKEIIAARNRASGSLGSMCKLLDMYVHLHSGQRI